jgi:hypothetical protein
MEREREAAALAKEGVRGMVSRGKGRASRAGTTDTAPALRGKQSNPRRRKKGKRKRYMGIVGSQF